MILPADPAPTCGHTVTTRRGVIYACTRKSEHKGDGFGCVLVGQTVDDKHTTTEPAGHADG